MLAPFLLPPQVQHLLLCFLACPSPALPGWLQLLAIQIHCMLFLKQSVHLQEYNFDEGLQCS